MGKQVLIMTTHSFATQWKVDENIWLTWKKKDGKDICNNYDNGCAISPFRGALTTQVRLDQTLTFLQTFLMFQGNHSLWFQLGGNNSIFRHLWTSINFVPIRSFDSYYGRCTCQMKSVPCSYVTDQYSGIRFSSWEGKQWCLRMKEWEKFLTTTIQYNLDLCPECTKPK